MSNQTIQPENLFNSSPYGFSQVVVSEGKKLVFCAGQTANDKDLNIIGKGDLKLQLEATFENVRTALAAAGAAPKDIISARLYIVDYTSEHLETISAAMTRFFNAESLPACTMVGVSALTFPEFLCEIEVVASIFSEA